MTTVFVTGASSGIGKVTALRLAKKGLKVIAAGRSYERLQNLRSEGLSGGVSIRTVQINLDDLEGLKNALDNLLSDGLQIDVLVNNAAYGVWGPLETLSDDKLRAQFNTNFFGTMSITRLLLPTIRLSKNGKIINVSSVLGRFGTPFNGAYVASKFALEGLSESLRVELAPFNVKVAIVEPGYFDTKFKKNQIDSTFSASCDISDSPYVELISRYKVRRKSYDHPGNPDKVAKVIETIINSKSPRFRYVVGADAKIILVIKNILPDRVFNYLIRRISLGL